MRSPFQKKAVKGKKFTGTASDFNLVPAILARDRAGLSEKVWSGGLTVIFRLSSSAFSVQHIEIGPLF
jgi:hypothetical protein